VLRGAAIVGQGVMGDHGSGERAMISIQVQHMGLRDVPPEFRARFLEERRDAREAAVVFARVCEEGRADQLYNAAQWLNECSSEAWRLAMIKVARLPTVASHVRDAFLPIWIESKMLPLRVGNRRVLADALRVLLPGNYAGLPLSLYRGASAGERRRRIYGFSWTTDITIARKFAEHWAQPAPIWGAAPGDGGVILKAVAPPEAILLMRQPQDYYDEGEVVVDPFRLGQIKLVERLRGPAVTRNPV
jgi:hypothetical protein